jgi:fluoride exporter
VVEILFVSAGGFVGANLRYAITIWAVKRFGPEFPVGTLIANLTGSLLTGISLGLFSGLAIENQDLRLLVAVGILGAETTYSTFMYESALFIRNGQHLYAALNLFGSIALGLATVLLGMLIAFGITGSW